MDVDFAELMKVFKETPTKRKYDWDEVYAYIQRRKFVTAREIRDLLKVKNSQLVYQWLNNHTGVVVDLDSNMVRDIDPNERIVKIVKNGNVAWTIREVFQQFVK